MLMGKINHLSIKKILKISFHKKHGFTLIELLISSALVLVLLSGIIGLLVNVNKINNASFMRSIAASYASSIMEKVLSYPYEEMYNGMSPTLYTLHNFSDEDPLTYRDAAASGIWDDSETTCHTPLPEEDLGYRRYRSSIWDDATNPPSAPENAEYNPDNPFPLGGNLSFPESYIGFEDDEIYFIPASDPKQFCITDSNYSSYYDAPCIYYADDIDDFDGTEIIINDVLADTDFRITIAVRGKYSGETGTYSFTSLTTGNTYSFALSFLEDMGEISPARFLSQFPTMSPGEPQDMAHDYYENNIYFKQIVITVRWEYPAQSGDLHYYSIYGGKLRN